MQWGWADTSGFYYEATLKLLITLLALLLGSTSCSSRTHLAAVDQTSLITAQRDTSAIVDRQDGGMPSADRALAKGAYCAIDGVLVRADAPRADAGINCR